MKKIVLILFASMSLTAIADGGRYHESSSCLKTASGTFTACKLEAKMNYAIDSARCLNSSDDECADELAAARRQEKKECRAMNRARIELCHILGPQAYIQDPDPDDFIDPTTITIANANPYLPLVRGNTWVYKAGDETISVTVTDQTVKILGISAVVVRDTVTVDGKLLEDTDDWFAQDTEGNVWYMGELSRNYEEDEDGQIWFDDTEGSWKAGDEEAQPGILVYAHPEYHIGETYRQEFLAGVAEDFARVESVSASTANDNFSCAGNCLQTYENSPFEPVGFDGNTPEAKFYLPGVGKIRSYHFDPHTGELAEGEEVDELISFTPGT